MQYIAHARSRSGAGPPQLTCLINHLVGASEQRRWDCEAERLCGPEMKGELKRVGCSNGRSAGLCPFENSIDKGRHTTHPLVQVDRIDIRPPARTRKSNS